MFFFPELMSYRLVKLVRNYHIDINSSINIQADRKGNALQHFNRSCRSYAGLGFIASFIPKTTAFNARKKLLVEIQSVIQKITEKISEPSALKRLEIWQIKAVLHGIIAGSLLAPLWKIVNENFHEHMNFNKIKCKTSVEPIALIEAFPLVNSLYIWFGKPKKRKQVREKHFLYFLREILNPIRIVDNLLSFAHRFLDIMLTAFFENYTRSTFRFGCNIIILGLKGLMSIVLFPLALFTKLAVAILDIPLDLIYLSTWKPCKFLFLSILQVSCDKEPVSPVANLEKKVNASPVANLPVRGNVQGACFSRNLTVIPVAATLNQERESSPSNKENKSPGLRR